MQDKQAKNLKIVGLDGSLSGSCFFEMTVNRKFEILDENFLLFVDTKTLPQKYHNCIYSGKELSTEYRIDQLAFELEARYLVDSNPVYFFMESPSYGSFGKVSNLEWSELYGVCKHYFRRYKQDYKMVSPKMLKKFTTNKGDADKELMVETFKANSKIDISYIPDRKTKSPIENIADSWALAETCRQYLKWRANGSIIADSTAIKKYKESKFKEFDKMLITTCDKIRG